MNLVFGIFYFLFLFNEIFSEDKEIKQINLNYNQNNDNLIETNVIINSEIYILPIDINSDKTWINKTNNFNLKNGYSMENNVNFSMESDTDENELNIVINEVNKEGIEMLSESNSFYNSNNK
jgi:hypothetical protein